ncbi:hypothetical protein CDEST_07750 [Colletotrichum destructivum]|uniref:Uncharacterized protein n=1 Tax=Colletotrichum destructivum TaxID=34406 RepID=A0AAX4IIG0_9PEZI|nr:hypothetical protein CDEST_07750 [Colletotrichum destructivum]
MKFLFFSSALSVASGVFAAPNLEPASLVARANCPTRQDCFCHARYDVGVVPPAQRVTVANDVSGQDSGLSTTEWRGNSGPNTLETCMVTVDRVCGDCSAWKVLTQKCQYGLGEFYCINSLHGAT